MKKLLKPEMEFIKFNTEDVITTSGEGGGTTTDTITFADQVKSTTTGNAHDSLDFSSGSNSLWNKPMQ